MFSKRGIAIYPGARVTSIEGTRDLAIGFDAGGQNAVVTVEKVIVSIGRGPRTVGIGIEGLGITLDASGYVHVGPNMQTSVPGVYAVGDVVPTPQLAHVGFAEAIVAIKTILGEPAKPIDYDKVPWGIYTFPEVGYAGLTEDKARAAGTTSSRRCTASRGTHAPVIIGEPDGIVKIVAERDGPILGVHIAGPWATELARRGLPGGELGGPRPRTSPTSCTRTRP